MTEYISRQGLRERLGIDPDGYCEKCRYLGMFGCNQSNEHLRACEAIDDEPAADVRPMVRGKWIAEKDRSYHWNCSQCGYVVGPIKMDCKFCPNCGADMREVTANGN